MHAKTGHHAASPGRSAKGEGLLHASPGGAALAEGEGFEPPDGFPPVVFKTTAIGRSATPPPDAAQTPTLSPACFPQATLLVPKARGQVNKAVAGFTSAGGLLIAIAWEIW